MKVLNKRELRIKPFDYKQKIDNKKKKNSEREILALNHDTLLFNYYEYLAICLFKSLSGKMMLNYIFMTY